jgi:hypothetical protein
MLERIQIQHIANRLSGSDVQIPDNQFDEPYRTVYRRIKPGLVSGSVNVEAALWQCLRGILDANAIADAILRALPADIDYPSLTRLAAEMPPVDWLWQDWIPRGMLSLLGASPGAGKSLVALDLARRIIHNLTWPDGTAIPTTSDSPVVYVDAEAIPQIQNQRAVAWNMNRDRIYLMLPPETYGMIDFCDLIQQDRLIDMCVALKPDLIVVDSLSAITVRGENNVEDVRALLGFLSAVAREFDAGLLLIHHLRKRAKVPLADLVTADDFRGSSHIIAMARSVLALSVIQDQPQPDRNGPRRLEIVKTNLCQYPKPLGILFKPEHPHAPPHHNTDPPHAYREPNQLEECSVYLVSLLEERNEPAVPKEMVQLLTDAGFSRATIYRARKELEGTILDTADNKRDPTNRWILADWELPEELLQ